MLSCLPCEPAESDMSSPTDIVIDNDGIPPPDTLTFLTYNVGLLRFQMFGLTVFSNPPHAGKRLPQIPPTLKSYPADILAIQECYEKRHADFLRESLKDLYPHSARVKSGGLIKFHNGLLVFSKYPIAKCELQRYHKVSSLEYHMATKSSLIVEVNIPGLGRVTFVNMHTTAGGTVDPEHPDADGDREDELRQAAEVCELARADGRIAIIIGDLNCGPEASAGNFNFILQRGFRDTYVEAVAAGKLLGGPEFTWDPKNYLNSIGPHKDSPGQRCDHVLLPTEGMENWHVEQAQVLFDQKVVDVGEGLMSTLSDHHGLMVVIKKQP